MRTRERILIRPYSLHVDYELCLFRILNKVVSQKSIKELHLKLNSATFGPISSDRKLNLKILFTCWM